MDIFVHTSPLKDFSFKLPTYNYGLYSTIFSMWFSTSFVLLPSLQFDLGLMLVILFGSFRISCISLYETQMFPRISDDETVDEVP